MIKNDLIDLDKIVFKWLCVRFCDIMEMCEFEKKNVFYISDGFVIRDK